jgi:hypothetical protein
VILVPLDNPSPAALGMWQLLETRYTCVFPVGDEPDPFLVREIRSFCPRFVPVLMWQEWRLPTGSKHVQAYHYIALHVTDVYDQQEDLGEPVAIEAFPPNFPFVGGGIYGQKTWSLGWPKHSREQRLNLPEMPLPFDRELVEYLRAVYHTLACTPGSIRAKVMAELIEDRKREFRLLAKVQEDTKGKLREHRGLIRKFIAEDGGPVVAHEAKRSVHIRIRPKAGSEGK